VGSRRGRHSALIGLAACLLAACTSGPPPGFAGGTGDRWAFPLVGTLEGDLLITPVTIDGRGPYLFGIDPDANVSLIDEQVVKDVRLRTHKGPHHLDETATQQPRFYAEVLALEIGSLIIVEATDRPELPRLAVSLSANADRVMQHLTSEWVGAMLTVVDATPYPRPCPADDGCVDLLAR